MDIKFPIDPKEVIQEFLNQNIEGQGAVDEMVFLLFESMPKSGAEDLAKKLAIDHLSAGVLDELAEDLEE